MWIRSSHRDSFWKYLFLFFRSNLFIIFREGPFVCRTDMNFPGGSIYVFFEQIQIFQDSRRAYRKDMFFQGGICSLNRPYFLIEQILIFPEINRSRWLLSIDKKINNILQWNYIDIKTGYCWAWRRHVDNQPCPFSSLRLAGGCLTFVGVFASSGPLMNIVGT